MAAQKLTLTKAAIVGGGAFAAYQFLYKPWKQAQDAAALAASSSGLLPYTSTGSGGGGGGLPFVSTPSTITPSNLDPGAAVGGAVGACMHKKGWTEAQCRSRLDDLVAAARGAAAELAKIASGQVAADVALQLSATRGALQNALQRKNVDLAAGDQAGAAQWQRAIDGFNSDISDLEGRNAAMITGLKTKWETALAGHKSNYLALTGFELAI